MWDVVDMSMELPQFVDHGFNQTLQHFPVYCEFKSDRFTMDRLHAHKGYEFHFSYSSEVTLIVGDRTYELAPGKIAIIRPLVFHAIKTDRSSEYRRTVLSVEEDYVESLQGMDTAVADILRVWFPSDEIASVQLTFHDRDLQKVRQLLLQLEAEIRDRPAHFPLMVKASFTELLVVMSRMTELTYSRHALSKELKTIVDGMLDYLTEHFREPIRGPELAERFHLSPSYLYKIFKLGTGMTPNQFLVAHRIGVAKGLLAGGGRTISEIVGLAGFNDISHFHKTFKEMTGTTPNAFRAQYA
ncbi:hypothetical protein DQG23_36805 [Paenibacillus contaminans]|uniref:HTH araC/xylS-type domain-containing protein n=2 Tax=Paenibacillus contaminans TaxID=450362 RepID=A0A329LTN7_9BACL|nr:hypothetical protein DQG23_36805 [Paenibacillus contaminans]